VIDSLISHNGFKTLRDIVMMAQASGRVHRVQLASKYPAGMKSFGLFCDT